MLLSSGINTTDTTSVYHYHEHSALNTLYPAPYLEGIRETQIHKSLIHSNRCDDIMTVVRDS